MGTNICSCQLHALRHRQNQHPQFTPPNDDVSASASDGVPSPENTSDSDYMEPTSVFYKDSAVETVGRKQLREGEENTDYTPDEPQMLTIKGRHLKRC